MVGDTPNPGRGRLSSALLLSVAIILAGPGLSVYVLGILIPGRVVRAAMVVGYTSMAAYRLLDQDTAKGRLDCHSVKMTGWEQLPVF